MFNYPQFFDLLLDAMHREQIGGTNSGRLNLKNLVEKYGLPYKRGALDDFKQDGRHRGLIRVAAAEVSEENIVASLTDEGAAAVRLWRMTTPAAPMIQPAIAESTPDDLIAAIIPASDRVVTAFHDLPYYIETLEKVQDAKRLVEQSNGLDGQEKAYILIHMEAGIMILTHARNFSVGAIRHAILDPLKKAFEGAIEDNSKATLRGTFAALATMIIWLIGS